MESLQEQEVKTQPQSLQKWNIATKEGMQRLIDYYNQKHYLQQKREKIEQIKFISYKVKMNEKGEFTTNLEEELNTLVKNNKLPLKLVLMQNVFGITHTDAVILSENNNQQNKKFNLIVLRDNKIEAYLKLKDYNIVSPKQTEKSIQGSDGFCHSIAIATLAKITDKQLLEYAEFKDDFNMPAELLMYSQSRQYVTEHGMQNQIIKKQRPATALKKEIPNDLTLGQYIDKYKIIDQGKVLQTRIGVKLKNWQEMFGEEDGLKERQQFNDKK